MILRNLYLQNFRSYKEKKFEFLKKTTLVVGDNAVGKTNLLEAVALLATGRSFKAGKNEEMIRNGAEVGRVEGRVHSLTQDKDGPFIARSKDPSFTDLEIILTKGEINGEKVPKKKLLVNGVAKRLMDFSGNLRVVLFEPEDLNLIIGSPGRRRNYLDFVLSQVDNNYYRCSLAYEKGLRIRNKLLVQIREREAHRHQLEYWDRLLVKNGQIIHSKRKNFINFINQQLSSEAMKQWNCLFIEYDDSAISPERLEKYAQVEVAAGMTLVGPHRDDFRIGARSQKPEARKDLAIYGSRGEQRMAALALKLSELEFVYSETDEKPLLLLDDIFSELDHEHRDYVMEIIGSQQTIITTADIHLVEKRFLKDMRMIELGL